jgi:hypothetical protein
MIIVEFLFGIPMKLRNGEGNAVYMTGEGIGIRIIMRMELHVEKKPFGIFLGLM